MESPWSDQQWYYCLLEGPVENPQLVELVPSLSFSSPAMSVVQYKHQHLTVFLSNRALAPLE